MTKISKTHIEFLFETQAKAEEMRDDFKRIVECGRKHRPGALDGEHLVNTYFEGLNNRIDFRTNIKRLDEKIKRRGDKYAFSIFCEDREEGKIGLYSEIATYYYPGSETIYTEADPSSHRFIRYDRENLISKRYRASINGREADIGDAEDLKAFLGDLYAPPENGGEESVRSVSKRIEGLELNEYATWAPEKRFFYQVKVDGKIYGIPVKDFEIGLSRPKNACIDRFIEKASKGKEGKA